MQSDLFILLLFVYNPCKGEMKRANASRNIQRVQSFQNHQVVVKSKRVMVAEDGIEPSTYGL